MNKTAYRLTLLVILALSFFIRFYKLGEVPRGLYQDETSIGYNAFSLLETGKDEYGKPYPLYFKSFGDYKLPVYVYLTVPSIKLFGLTPFAVRLPSALFGFLTIPILYLTLQTFTKNNRLALTSALLLAINPWHIHYSRATFEVTIALFFFLLGTWLLKHAYERKTGAFLFGALCFIIAFYSYNLTRLLAPILFVSVHYYLYQKNKMPRRNEMLTTLVVCCVLLFPFVKTFLSPAGMTSSIGTLIFTSSTVQAPLQELRSYMLVLPTFITKMFFNYYVLTFWQYITNVISYLSVNFFFITGSTHGNHGIGNIGLFYLFELPLMLTGLYLFIKERSPMVKLLLPWTFFTIAVAALTRESPHATRSFFLLFPLTVFSANGMLAWFMHIQRILQKPLRTVLTCVTLLFMLYSVFFYFFSYFIRFPIYYAKAWRAGDAQVSQYIFDHEKNYSTIVIDKNSGFIYSSLLFYTAFPPHEFQASVHRLSDDSEGFSFVASFNKFEIREINDDDFRKPDTLIITTPEKKPEFVKLLATFYYPPRPVVLALKQEIVRYPIEEIGYIAVETKPQ